MNQKSPIQDEEVKILEAENNTEKSKDSTPQQELKIEVAVEENKVEPTEEEKKAEPIEEEKKAEPEEEKKDSSLV